MPSSYVNGRADLAGPPILLGDFLPEQRKVVLNGQEYLAWVTVNKRYPRRIMAALDSASRRYSRVIQPLLVPEPNLNDLLPGELEELQALREDAAEEQQAAYNSYVSECISLLVQSLPESEADMIPLEEAENLLRILGFFRPVEAAPIEKKEGADEEPVVPLTGATSPEDSPTSIRGTRKITS